MASDEVSYFTYTGEEIGELIDQHTVLLRSQRDEARQVARDLVSGRLNICNLELCQVCKEFSDAHPWLWDAGDADE